MLEETGLAVEAVGAEIGRRVHPATRRLMIYIPCQPTGDLTVRVCDHSLAEVNWVSLEDLRVLMPGVFEPVRAYLQRELAEKGPTP